MKSETFQTLDQHVRALEQLSPNAGGNVRISQGPDKGLIVIDGDRIALIRLSVALLRYAIDARFKEGHSKVEAKSMEDFFIPPSKIRDLFMQIDETPPERQKTASRPPSLTKLVSRALSPKPRE
jgi:hypothetical protein